MNEIQLATGDPLVAAAAREILFTDSATHYDTMAAFAVKQDDPEVVDRMADGGVLEGRRVKLEFAHWWGTRWPGDVTGRPKKSLHQNGNGGGLSRRWPHDGCIAPIHRAGAEAAAHGMARRATGQTENRCHQDRGLQEVPALPHRGTAATI